MKILSRKEARTLGRTRYFTSKSCKHGHTVERLTSNATCVRCVLNRPHRWKKTNWKKHLSHCQTWKHKHKADVSKAGRKYYISNSTRIQAFSKVWRQENKARVTFSANKRRAQKLKATPMWANENKIIRLYEKAERLTTKMNKKYVVDHIVPLQSKLVCGLHCEQNLRVITQKYNSRKLNSSWPDMPNV